MGLAAGKLKVLLPAELLIDTEIDLCHGEGGYFLRARLNINMPGVHRDSAQAVIEAAHQTCPYSKATRGNVEVAIRLIG